MQVSHTEMRDVVLSSGIAPEKVFLIPIGINLSFFTGQTPESRRQARARLGIPESAVVVGSFQKDGVAGARVWQPKLIKGPDVFLKAVDLLSQRIPELFVLLSGPARGYVKAGLERLRVPYQHHLPEIVSGGGAVVSGPGRLHCVLPPGRRPQGGFGVHGQRGAPGDHQGGAGHGPGAA